MTTLAELVAATPSATRGVPTGFTYGSGQWRHVVEIANPSAGASVAWHDITAYMATGGPFTGYEYTRGSDGYQGRYRASVATIDLWAKTDELAPWNPDTSPTFGVHVKLGPGLLIRSGFIRVVGSTVDAWNPRFTNKIEVWGDASYSHGKARQHRIIARDTLTSAVGIPLPASFEENWSDRMYHWLTDSGWPYGSAIYGAQFEADTTTPILLLPDRPAVSNAINELDAICDPVGLVWYTNRLGQLVVRPTVYDTFHADAFAAGATGDQWPTDVMPIGFSWAACSGGDFTGNASYAVDHSPSAPFGLDETETSVINHVVITAPTGTFDDDDPISIQRYDRHSFQASWIAENDTVAAAILDFRKDATVEARPLHTTIDLPGFHPGPARAEYLDYVTIDHRNSDDGLGAFANGYVRSYREQVTPRGCDTAWALTFTLDVYNVTSDAGLLPVEDLILVDVTDTSAEFSWTNPTQTITPTHTQVRLLNPASLWLTTDYPILGLEWAGLAPSTGYEFQVRLIRVVDGLVTHYSPTRTLNFTTADGLKVDVNGDIHVDPPDPDPGCIVGWELSWSVDGDVPWTVIDSGSQESGPPWDFHIDTTLLNDDYWYRVCTNEICGGVGGAFTCSPLFPIGCMPTARLLDPPYDDVDLIAYWPEVCPDHISEALSDQPMTFGPAWGGVGFDDDGIPVMQSGSQGIIGYGAQPAAPDGFDMTIACRVKIGTQPTSEVTLFAYDGMWISAVASGAGYRIHGNFNEAEAGIGTISGATTLALDTEYTISLVHYVTGPGSGDLTLYVGTSQDAHASGAGQRFATGFYLIGVPADSWITDSAVWDQVLDFPTAVGSWGGWTATATGGAFNPLTAMTNLDFWLEGSNVVTSGSNITQITNLQPSVGDYFKPSAAGTSGGASASATVGASINGHQTISVNADAVYRKNAVATRWLSDDVYDIYVVFKGAAQANKALVSQHSGLANSGRTLWGTADDGTGAKARTFFNNGTSRTGLTSGTVYDNNPHVYRFHSTGAGDHYVQVDQGTDELVITGQQVTPENTAIRIFGTGGDSPSGPIASMIAGLYGEILMAHSVQSGTVATNTMNYLKAKWGTP